ncbi:NUDIX domain-containing protein [Streptomyces sp. cg36]|uniref:NUDIX domain-containing protein n=1 Tax=Streptomyces sp. cg36 TaxID=3238798 RepID=UPI0034E1A174
MIAPMPAAAVLVQHEGRVLMVHHVKTGHWVIPGGRAEDGETPRHCAAREALEETGVPVQVGRLLVFQHLPAGTYGNGANPMPCHLFVFAAMMDPADHERIRVPDRELLGHDWLPPGRAVELTDHTNTPLLGAALAAAADGTTAYLEYRPHT